MDFKIAWNDNNNPYIKDAKAQKREDFCLLLVFILIGDITLLPCHREEMKYNIYSSTT